MWRNDPASFENYPEFFLAHEVAHQWWGQAVGWRNYHEQWLSEGFAQYFAALYAQHQRGDDVFGGDASGSMRKWAIDDVRSGAGLPRLPARPHPRRQPRLRALVYNKGATVLHMLRRLVGRRGVLPRRAAVLRRIALPEGWHRRICGSRWKPRRDGRSIAFFERWIYGSDLPALTWTTRTEGTGENQAVVIRFEQGTRVFDLPITVSVQSMDGSFKDIVVKLTEQVVEERIPVTGKIGGDA